VGKAPSFPLHFLHGAANATLHQRPHQYRIEGNPSPTSPILSFWCESGDVRFLESSGLWFVNLSLYSTEPSYLQYVSACLVLPSYLLYSLLPPLSED